MVSENLTPNQRLSDWPPTNGEGDKGDGEWTTNSACPFELTKVQYAHSPMPHLCEASTHQIVQPILGGFSQSSTKFEVTERRFALEVDWLFNEWFLRKDGIVFSFINNSRVNYSFHSRLDFLGYVMEIPWIPMNAFIPTKLRVPTKFSWNPIYSWDIFHIW